MKQVIEYIQKNYDPLCLILYGSYADGTNRLNSDFDALVITADHEPFHDTSLVAGIPLDVFVLQDILKVLMRARTLFRSLMDA